MIKPLDLNNQWDRFVVTKEGIPSKTPGYEKVLRSNLNKCLLGKRKFVSGFIVINLTQ